MRNEIARFKAKVRLAEYVIKKHGINIVTLDISSISVRPSINIGGTMEGIGLLLRDNEYRISKTTGAFTIYLSKNITLIIL